MQRHLYVGDESDKALGPDKKPIGRNLGRFGLVKPGDFLVLTPHESLGVIGDPRFELYDPKKHDGIVPPVDPEAEKTAQLEAFRQMNIEQLRTYAKDHGINFNPRTSADRLLRLILAQVSNPNAPKTEDGGEEEP